MYSVSWDSDGIGFIQRISVSNRNIVRYRAVDEFPVMNPSVDILLGVSPGHRSIRYDISPRGCTFGQRESEKSYADSSNTIKEEWIAVWCVVVAISLSVWAVSMHLTAQSGAFYV